MEKKMTSDINLLEIKDIQRILKIGKNAAYSLMKSDSFPSMQLGRKWLVTEDAFKEWLEDNKYCKIIIDN